MLRPAHPAQLAVAPPRSHCACFRSPHEAAGIVFPAPALGQDAASAVLPRHWQRMVHCRTAGACSAYESCQTVAFCTSCSVPRGSTQEPCAGGSGRGFRRALPPRTNGWGMAVVESRMGKRHSLAVDPPPHTHTSDWGTPVSSSCVEILNRPGGYLPKKPFA